MTVFSLVASHHDLDLDTVARLSAGATGVGPALPGSGAAGAVVLATCNRVEIYAEADGAGVEAARTGLLSAVAASTSLPDEDVHTAFRTLDADATARHLFEVGAGLDSAVVGEREIAGQVRRALTAAQEAGTASGPPRARPRTSAPARRSARPAARSSPSPWTSRRSCAVSPTPRPSATSGPGPPSC